MQVAIAVLVLVNLLVLMWGSFQTTGSAKAFQQPETGNLRLLTGYVPSSGVAHAVPAESDIVTQAAPSTEQQLEQVSALLNPAPPNPLPAEKAKATANPPQKALKLAQNQQTEKDLAQQWATQAREVLSGVSAKDNSKSSSDDQTIEKQKDVKVLQLPPEVPPPSNPPVAKQAEPVLPNTSVEPKVDAGDGADSIADTAKACWRVGAFTTKDLARNAALKRPENVALTRITEETDVTHLGYIVIVPAQNGLQGAEKTVKQLRQKKIKDFQIMKSGPFIHAVSLGVFKERANAQRWAQSMHKKGLQQVVMRERVDEKNNYWLELRSDAIMNSSGDLQSVYSDVLVRNVECK